MARMESKVLVELQDLKVLWVLQANLAEMVVMENEVLPVLKGDKVSKVYLVNKAFKANLEFVHACVVPAVFLSLHLIT